MFLENREGHTEFNCEPDRVKDRTPGLAALVRLHNEEAWIACCLDSIVGWFDEIVVCLNLCTDATPDIVERFRKAYPEKIKVHDYPFKIHAMGPGHDRCPADSVHGSAYFYNFCQAQSTRSLVCKVDGDLVFFDWAGAEIRRLMAEGKERIKFEGIDLVGDEVAHIGCHPRCPTNGIYRVREGVFYRQGPMTQNLAGVDMPPYMVEKPMFLHFKWARKSFESATAQWPENWREIPHFQRIAERRHPVERYEGPYPASVRALIQGNNNAG